MKSSSAEENKLYWNQLWDNPKIHCEEFREKFIQNGGRVERNANYTLLMCENDQ